MADLSLADAMDAPEALLQAVRVPGQVVVDHQMGALQVNTLTGGIGGDQYLDLRVVAEELLHLEPLFATHPAMDGNHGLNPTEQRTDALHQVVQRVAMLREEHQLLAR